MPIPHALQYRVVPPYSEPYRGRFCGSHSLAETSVAAFGRSASCSLQIARPIPPKSDRLPIRYDGSLSQGLFGKWPPHFSPLSVDIGRSWLPSAPFVGNADTPFAR